ncbi:probable ubiquitin carboxyl-terminal hydrolase MINDY-4 isoform X2 [Pteropus alecto]|uniref:probable ubiquitin carboxyl-terminal hydrolase MINDY-4 isoform X2 n=1 Tax=Pteropus alecto TaxID=9402 RepID=UPI0007688A64|nr:probable ubiquitin carboxyl-terminal hydrolase MINDY-4 isoform X2 [Pteropus alecto]
MDGLFVEEVAASLVREFLSRKGLKKTCVTMDQERPRSDLSINSRNDLRKLLHLEFLYKENKAKENPLKTNLELITRYFLDHFGNTAKSFTQEAPIPALSNAKKNNKLPLRCSETTLVNIYDLADDEAAWRTSLSEASKARHDSLDGDVLGNLVSSRRPPHKSKPAQMVPAESLPVAPTWEKMDKLQPAEPPLDTRRVGEKDSLRRRSLRRPPALSSMTLPHEEEEESRRAPELSTRTPACPAPREGLASSARSPLGQLSEPTSEKHRPTPSSPPHLLSPGLLQRGSGRWRELSEDSPAMDSGPETSRTPSKFLPGGNARTAQERLERVFKRQGSPSLPLRRNQLPVSNKADGELGVLQLEDVEDESIREEVILSPVPSMLKLQIVSKPIDLSVAKDIKTLLFGSSFCCFNEEWKLQSFSFSDAASLKYGIVQNKGGPCGVLAAVQGCVLQKLLFEGDSRADCARQLQPSNTHRTHCLALAIADIVWRAGGHRRAVVTLASGTQQFSPTGKYKADGVLETLVLYTLTCYEELVTFLQQSVHQFEVGPYGCILLTLSAILSRSTELVRQDFDVPTSHLIGAHGYCTQELVNLLLTGKASSNTFNDVVELDSGNGDVTLLKGIAARSDVGFLSLFEHYNVCQLPRASAKKHHKLGGLKQQKLIVRQFWSTGWFSQPKSKIKVGCFLKTPRFPIWVVCSESHFSVLFSLQPELLRDWRTERLFDLYYYDGLANQQEQIRLTVDTTQTVPEDGGSDLIPPLELCIRTKTRCDLGQHLHFPVCEMIGMGTWVMAEAPGPDPLRSRGSPAAWVLPA